MLLDINFKRSSLFFIFCVSSLLAGAQDYKTVIQKYLQENKLKWSLSDQDISHYRISDQYTDRNTNITYVYLHQEVSGIRIFNAVSAMAIRNGEVVSYANRFYANAASKANSSNPVLRPDAAILAAAGHLGKPILSTPKGDVVQNDPSRWQYDNCGIADKPIKVELMYVPVAKGFSLAWNVNIKLKGSADWWNVRIDALNGTFIEKNNWTVSCEPVSMANQGNNKTINVNKTGVNQLTEINNGLSAYNVFPFPVESPNFGVRSILTDPNDLTASPYGWHDTDGVDGAEFNITRGNNVFAYEDHNNADTAGHSPNGGVNLYFDYPLDLNKAPEEYLDASLTNLFYLNNRIHDVLYHYGFDEISGNFQQNNYGKGGAGNDYVFAEGQDGGGTSNANFSTPDDGQNGAMQMYLWPTEVPSKLTVNTPASIADNYDVIGATFGPSVTVPITADAVLIEDDTDPFNDGCENIVNAAELKDKIVIIDRGLCIFTLKVLAAQQAGALAVVVINNTGGAPYAMPGAGNINIPSVMISQADGALIKQQLALDSTVNITLNPPGGSSQDRDGSLDNGIVAHEYGHGVSTRLTGGPSNSNCLNNNEEGGEGWSDWLAMILTIEPGDAGTDSRGMGTYALNENAGAQGIRRFPYSTDMNINPQTYGDLAVSGEVHDIGEIWCQVLWDMTWKLIDAESFDQNWISGTGGNNTAMKLVLQGMKLQPCGPGFLDGRDAILGADQLLYNNAHRCMIWEAFAGRGMGYNAKQGSSNVAGDETENFDLPFFCQTAIVAPNASFVVDTVKACYGDFVFTDQSTDIPQEWLWDFGDGTTSTEMNPKHSYNAPGTYTVTLTVTNTIGQDSYTYIVTYETQPAPNVTGNVLICENNSSTLIADVAAGYTANWYLNGKLIFTGDTLITPNLLDTTIFTAEQVKDDPILHVGPLNNTFGTGGNHNTNFEGKLLFEAFAPFTLKSALVYAQGAGQRTFNLYNESDVLIQAVTVFVTDGSSRIDLNMDIPSPGLYSVGNKFQNLYRNNGGAKYPYLLNNIVSIYQCNAPTGPNSYYYYLYDWEVQKPSCPSAPTNIKIDVTPGPVAEFASVATKLIVTFTDKSTNNPNSWVWNFGDGSPESTQQNPVHTYTADGTYIVTLTASNGVCSSTSHDTITVTKTSSVGDENNRFKINLFPNPANSEVNIQILGDLNGVVKIDIADALGKVVRSIPINQVKGDLVVNTSLLASGVYYVQIKGNEGQVVKKLTIIK